MNAVLSRPPTAQRPLVDAAFLADPYPAYRALREAGPLHWSEEFFGGAWLLTRHADVEGLLRDPRFSAQRTGGWVNQAAAERGELAGFQQLFARSLLFLDAPDHGRLRALLQPAFRPEALARLKPRIERIADELIDGLDHADEFDFIARLARPLPVRVISAILGIEGADRAEVMAWSDDLAAFIGAPEPSQEQARRAQASLLAMTRYFQAQLAAKREAPDDSLLSGLLAARERGEIRDDAELLAQCAMLLFAGHETTRNLLGNGLFALLSHPAQWARLREDPALVPGAVRELLRYDSPVQYTGRRVTTDLMLHGQLLRRGDLVLGADRRGQPRPGAPRKPRDARHHARRPGGPVLRLGRPCLPGRGAHAAGGRGGVHSPAEALARSATRERAAAMVRESGLPRPRGAGAAAPDLTVLAQRTPTNPEPQARRASSRRPAQAAPRPSRMAHSSDRLTVATKVTSKAGRSQGSSRQNCLRSFCCCRTGPRRRREPWRHKGRRPAACRPAWRTPRPGGAPRSRRSVRRAGPPAAPRAAASAAASE